MTVKNWVPHHLQDKPGLVNIWLASTLPKQTFFKHCSKRNVQAIDLGPICDEIKNNTISSSSSNRDNNKALNLSTSSRLITGVLEIAKTQDDILLDEIEKLIADMNKVSKKSKSKDPVEDFPEVVIDLPVVEDDELTLIQYSPQHIRTITMDEDPLFFRNDITLYDEPINNLEFSRDLPRNITLQEEVTGEQSDEYFIEKPLPKTTKRKAQPESFCDTPTKRQRITNNDIQKDYELPDCEPCVNIPILEEPSIPNETIHENIETIHENVETIPENIETIHDNTGTIEQEKTIVDEQAPAPAAIVNNIQLDDNASLIGTDSPRQRLPKKRRSIINEFDTISVETLTHTLRNIQLRVLKIDDCLIGDVQRNHNTLVNLKRYPGYTWQEERFTQVSLNVGHFFSNNVMIPRAITTDHQRRQETQQDIHQDVSNFIANKPVEDNITSQIDEQSVDQVFPNEALPNQQESNLNILPEPTIDLLPTQDIANTNVQILDTQLVTPAQFNSEQQVADNNYDNQHDLNVNGNVDLSMYEDRVINPSPESLNYVITKTDVEERLNMCREKNLFPLSFYDLFPSDVDSKNDAVLGFYHLLDIAGENGNEWNLYQSEQLLIEYCSKDFSFSYK